jgi:hypothetical protein
VIYLVVVVIHQAKIHHKVIWGGVFLIAQEVLAAAAVPELLAGVLAPMKMV